MNEKALHFLSEKKWTSTNESSLDTIYMTFMLELVDWKTEQLGIQNLLRKDYWHKTPTRIRPSVKTANCSCSLLNNGWVQPHNTADINFPLLESLVGNCKGSCTVVLKWYVTNYISILGDLLSQCCGFQGNASLFTFKYTKEKLSYALGWPVSETLRSGP